MSSQIIRRVYLYAAAFIGLQLLATGAAELIAALLEPVLAAQVVSRSTDTLRLSLPAALVLVALPFWAGHWRWAQRALVRTEERQSTLRRLYLYGVLLVAIVNAMTGFAALLGSLLDRSLGDLRGMTAAGAFGRVVVYGAIWAYHWRVAARDRLQTESSGGTATLRRWYMVLTLGAALGMASYAAVDLLHQLLASLTAPAIGGGGVPAWSIAALVAGLAVWAPHQRWATLLLRHESTLQDDERDATLRRVYGALVVAAALIAALGGLTVLLYWALRAAFGDLGWTALIAQHTTAPPVVLVATTVWWYHRVRLADEARLSARTTSVDTAERIVGYTTAAVALVALFFGLGGLLSTLLRLVVAPDALGGGWHGPLSRGLALALVALPVYTLTLRALQRRRRPGEELAIARRLYLYGALLFAISASVVALVALLQQLISRLLGDPDAGGAAEIARWLGYALVGGALTAAYTYTLRLALRSGSRAGGGRRIALLGDEPLRSLLAAAVKRELPDATLTVGTLAEAPTLAVAIAAADTLLVPVAALVDSASGPLVGAYRGRRLLVPDAVPGYELLGVRSHSALAREVARALRATPPLPLPPIGRPDQIAQPT